MNPSAPRLLARRCPRLFARSVVLFRASSAALCLAAAALPVAPSPARAAEREWSFDVFLGDSPIGSQRFVVRDDGERSSVSIEADFDVKILFFSAYTYRHRNHEEWEGDCLRSIDATTDDDGEALRVEGRREGDGFEVQRQGATDRLPSCVRSFAYWAPSRLHDAKLLNSQTGIYENVTFMPVGDETVAFRGRDVAAKRWDLAGSDFRIALWYARESDEWLRLESDTKSGRRLRYVRR